MSLRGTVKKPVFSCGGCRGFTLIEVLVAVAIGSLVMVGASKVLTQLFVLVPKAESSMLAMRQVQFAGHWIDRDATMAQVITPTDNLTHNLCDHSTTLVMSHVEWSTSDNTTVVKTVTYSVDTNNKLKRQEVVKDEKTDTEKSRGEIQVANSITSLTFTVLKGVGVVLTDNITAQVGSASESRTYKTKPRSF